MVELHLTPVVSYLCVEKIDIDNMITTTVGGDYCGDDYGDVVVVVVMSFLCVFWVQFSHQKIHQHPQCTFLFPYPM
jgi:hypothetical protein